MRRGLLAALLVSIVVCPGHAENRAANADSPARPAALTTVAQVFAQPGVAFNVDRPLSLSGIVTLADAGRNLLVLQDETGAIALHPDPPDMPARPGQRISLMASACVPYVMNCPDYPWHPAGGDIQPALELPGDTADFRLTRMRGWLRPPTTGQYTFWIASDNSSELWLGAGADPTDAHRIALVKSTEWTDPHEWSRFPTQRSASILLHAGQDYYIEVIHEQQMGENHMSVSWEGPGLKQAIIDGRYLVPWDVAAGGIPAGTGQGILREYWDNYAVANLAPITDGVTAEGGLKVRGLETSVLAEGVWPEPRSVVPGQRVVPDDLNRWVEGQGAVGFAASDGTSATLEIVSGENRMPVRVARWQGDLPQLRPNLHAKFRGVCEGAHDSNGNLIAGSVSSPSGQDVSFFEAGDAGALAPASSSPAAVGPALGGFYFTRGVVTFNDRVGDKDRMFVQEAFGGISISQAQGPIASLLQVGQFAEVGGNLLPGRFAPAILPMTVNIRGWQNFPAPAIPSAEAPAASYRDGLWTEVEGVVRSVNGDGTMVLMGRQVPLLVWVGRTDLESLRRFVNSTLRIRGVMSLDTFDAPVLLVPSRSFVEIVEPAPEVPVAPVPVASLRDAHTESGWVHEVKVAGTTTYRGDGFFYLQDDTGAVRVQPIQPPPSEIGGAVEATGFPGREGVQELLSNASWRSIGTAPPVAAAGLNARNPEPGRNGMLVNIEALLLSQRTRGASGTERILELQAGGHDFEAVLANSQAPLPELATGSLLSVTGVCILEPVSASDSVGGAPMSLARFLLRTPNDVTVLRGAPWWTWKRVTVLIGILVAVLAGSLLRIFIMKRRFARQQAARLLFAREMLENQEGERRRIAASLHDSLGQNLLVIRNQAQRALQSATDKSPARQRLEEISDATLHAINEVREITHNLRPYQLDRLGLTQAISALARKVSETSPVELACHVDEVDGIFDKESEIHIYRIVQEGINNIVKHSGATEATVVIKNASGRLSISIRDNGRGLAANSASSAAGFGLTSIRERAQIMGGTAGIDSAPGHGVNLHIDLPLPSTPERPPS